MEPMEMMSSMIWIINSSRWMTSSIEDLDRIKEDKLINNSNTFRVKEVDNYIIEYQIKILKIFNIAKGDNRCNNKIDVPTNKIIFNLHNSEISPIRILETEIIPT